MTTHPQTYDVFDNNTSYPLSTNISNSNDDDDDANANDGDDSTQMTVCL